MEEKGKIGDLDSISIAVARHFVESSSWPNEAATSPNVALK